MKSYLQTRGPVHYKNHEQKENDTKKKTIKTVFLSIVATCLIIGGAVAFASTTPLHHSAQPSQESNTYTLYQSSITEREDVVESDPEETTCPFNEEDYWPIALEPPTFPQKMKRLAAVLVTWGTPTDCYADDWSFYWEGDEQRWYPVHYVGVSVSVDYLYSSTVSEYTASLSTKLEEAKIFLVPSVFLETIKAGDTSLVFVTPYPNLRTTDAFSGNFSGSLYGPQWSGKYDLEKRGILAVFPIRNGILEIPEGYPVQGWQQFSALQDCGYVISALREANHAIQKSGADIPRFVSGMKVNEIEAFFDYFVQEE